MAQVEFTQQWKYSAANAGVLQPPAYLQMQPVAGAYIIKGLWCYSTSGIQVTGSATLPSISFTNGDSATPTTLIPIFAIRDEVDPNALVQAATPLQQVILKQPYISFTANMAGAGDFVFQISYSFIPASEELSTTFLNSLSSVASGATGGSLTGSSSTVATIIKSITVLNLDEDGDAATVTPLIVTPTNAVATRFAGPLVLEAGFSGTFTFPLYLNNLTTVSIQNAGPAAVQILYSYTHEIV
mgnify:CR=1 FL=1